MGNTIWISFAIFALLVIPVVILPLWLFDIFCLYDSQPKSAKVSFFRYLINTYFGDQSMNRTQTYHSFSVELSPPTSGFPKGQPYIQWFYEDGTESKRSPYLSSVEAARNMALRHARQKRGLPAMPVGPNEINKPASTALVPVSPPYTPPLYNYTRYVAETFDEKWTKGVKKFLPDYEEETK